MSSLTTWGPSYSAVYVVDPGLDRFPKQLDRIVAVRRRPEHARRSAASLRPDGNHAVGAECSVGVPIRRL